MMKKKATTKKSAKAPDAKQLRAELCSELTVLRTTFQDIVARYQSNLEAQMLACIEMFSGDRSDELPGMAEDEKQLRTALEAVKKLRLKPQKGRLKDLRQIQAAIERIVELSSQS